LNAVNATVSRLNPTASVITVVLRNAGLARRPRHA
jgi:hypothetical protein